MKLVKEIYMGSATPGSGGGSAIIDPLNVTPSTSAQTITASGGTDGYSPVNVAAVTSSIDANIVAGNIKNGVEILGVTGSVVELNGETVSVTPTTSSQTITPTSPKNAITEITVNAVTSSIDANITTGNIKKDVTILGVTGTLESGITPTGTISITTNGTHDVTNYANADVNVPTTAPAHYVEYEVTGGGTLQQSHTTPFINTSGATYIGAYGLVNAYNGSTVLSSVDLSSIESVGESGLKRTFYGSSITSLDLSGLGSVSGLYYGNAFDSMCYDCTLLTSVDISSLRFIAGYSQTAAPFYSTFSRCTGLRTIRFSSLNEVGQYSFPYTFSNCQNIDLYFPCLTVIDSNNAFRNACNQCTNVTLHFPSNMQSAVEACTQYSATAPFGASSGSVLFDLPATVNLTGADSITYSRNPKYDTGTALAWKVGNYASTTLTPYYTSGTTDPAVSDTIYSDAACTTAVTTIASIA